MDVFIAILVVIVFVALSGSGKKKPDTTKAPSSTPSQKASPAPVSATPRKKPAPADAKTRPAELTGKPVSRPRPVSPVVTETALPGEGESFIDKHGCIGGSLMYHSEEGESAEEHAIHMNHSLPVEESRANRIPCRYSAQDIRHAVIMREILDRPKSLRNYR